MLTRLVHTPVHEHRCQTCGTAFEMTHIVDHSAKDLVIDKEGNGEPEHIHVTVVCPNCCAATTLTFPFKSPPLEWLLKAIQRDHN